MLTGSNGVYCTVNCSNGEEESVLTGSNGVNTSL